MRLRRSIFPLMVLCTAFYSGMLSAGGLTAAQVQSAYIFQISKFVTWPDARMAGETFNICHFPSLDLNQMLRQMEGRRILQKNVHIVEIPDENTSRDCHVLFIGNGMRLNTGNLIKNTSQNNILTIGESEHMLTYSMLTLPLLENKVELQVNLNLLNAANLHMSTNLLEIASKVIKGDTP